VKRGLRRFTRSELAENDFSFSQTVKNEASTELKIKGLALRASSMAWKRST
jgi:uncharacterized membrane protein YqiK